MCKIISVINHKGGVGKTTTTVNLGASLSRKGKKVLLVDFDPQANTTQNFNAEDAEVNNITDVILRNEDFEFVEVGDNLHLVKGDLELAEAERILANKMNTFYVLKQKLETLKDYDVIIIDCPPSLGFFPLNALNASTDVLIVTEATRMGGKGVETMSKLIREVQDFGNKYLNLSGIVISKFNSITSVNRDSLEFFRSEYGDLIYDSIIRHYTIYEKASNYGETVYLQNEGNADKAKADFDALANEVMKKMKL